MSWTAADLKAVEDAIRDVLTGKTVSFGGKMVGRESLTELRSLRQEMKTEIAEDSGTGGGVVFTTVMRND